MREGEDNHSYNDREWRQRGESCRDSLLIFWSSVVVMLTYKPTNQPTTHDPLDRFVHNPIEHQPFSTQQHTDEHSPKQCRTKGRATRRTDLIVVIIIVLVWCVVVHAIGGG